MKKCKQGIHRLRCWITGSIRRKLTLFVVVLCILLVSLVGTLMVALMEPVYNSFIRRDLENTMHNVVSVLEKAQNDGVEMTGYTLNLLTGEIDKSLSEDCVVLINEAIEKGLISSRYSIDISGSDLRNLYLTEPNAISSLYPYRYYGAGLPTQAERNGELITTYRLRFLQFGYDIGILKTGQMLVGTTTANSQYIVVVATDVERISQAVKVVRQLLFPILLLLLFIAVVGTWAFSRWFTRPLNRLSRATKEVAKGNYEVALPEDGMDEIAALACNFNVMTREVKRSAELQRDLIANVSHDLRTPLTLIKGYAETIRDLTGDDPNKRTEQLTVIMDETNRLSTLVNSVMELSRVSSGHEKAEPVRFSLTQLGDEVGYRYTAVAKQEGYQFDFQAPEDLEIVADPAMIERVLHNLLGNAVKHVGADGYVGLHIIHKGNKARVEVIDHGPGIAAGDLPHLFDRYYRSRDDAGKPGTGLGLSITKAIFQMHSFEYGVESEPGQGATFWFEAPLAEGKA